MIMVRQLDMFYDGKKKREKNGKARVCSRTREWTLIGISIIGKIDKMKP